MTDSIQTPAVAEDGGKSPPHWLMDFVKLFLTVSAPVVIYLLGANSIATSFATRTSRTGPP
jgi:hypothetical protein